MRPPRPLPVSAPFLTFYTVTFRRPAALWRNMASIGRQTAVERVEQIVLPDHVGYGLVGGLFGRIAWYAEAVRGDYVHILNDDDELADARVVERLQAFVVSTGSPPVVVVRGRKGGVDFPRGAWGVPPEEGLVDLGNYVLRRDVWTAHVNDYGMRYQGDYDHARALFETGHRFEFLDMLFFVGGAGGGRPETDL